MRLFVFLALCYASSACYGISFLSFDPDSMATGGAGSVTGIGGGQPFLSPTTFNARGSCCVLRAYVGARLIDRQHFIATAEEIKEAESELKLDQRLDAVRSAFKAGDLDSGALRELGGTADQLIEELNKLPDKPLRVSASAGVYSLGQGQRFSAGAFSRQYLVLGALIKNDPEDLLRIQQLQKAAYALSDVMDSSQRLEHLGQGVDWKQIERLALASVESRTLHPKLQAYEQLPGVAPVIRAVEELHRDLRQLDEHVDLKRLATALMHEDPDPIGLQLQARGMDLRSYLRYPIPDHINSRIVFSGAEVDETGLNFSFSPSRLPDLTLGVNVKEVQFSTIAFIQRIDAFQLEQYQDEATRRDHRFWNLDLGARYELTPHWSVGGVVKNLHRKQVETVLQTRINLSPIARVGIAYRRAPFTIAFDADLTKNEPLGLDPHKQYLAIGAQLNYWKRNTLRLGYRYNYIDHTGLPAAGLGFQVGPALLDLAATYSPANDEAGVSVQTGLAF